MIRPARDPRFLFAAALAATWLASASAYAAAPYPTNLCVGNKQKAAGVYCKNALKAWAKWDDSQDAAARDAALQAAADKLATKWGKAEEKSQKKGVDCADTTLTADAAVNQIDSAIAAIVGEVNDGLDLGTDGACGKKLLTAAAVKCGKLLIAESVFVKTLAKDPKAEKRNEKRAKASDTFDTNFQKTLDKGCPSTATSAGIENRVDLLAAGIITDTTVSPNVDDAQYTTITPTGPIHYQDRDFSPMCMNGSPYAYFVKRGSLNKLLIYYQGGGACWENLTCSVPVCDTSVNPAGSDNPNNASTGFADAANPLNPFKDWNVVFVSYCSCDVHFGDAAQDYSGILPDIHVEHRGYQNSRVVEKWTREHFVNPEEIFVTGSSAGAYGAWFNAPLHEFIWPASHFNVLADAGNGVITQQFLDTQFPHWNFAANVPTGVIPGLEDTLTNGTGIPGYTKVVADFFPDTRWAHYSTAYDGGTGGQTGFYNVMLNPDDVAQWGTWWHASCAYNAKMRQQAIDTAGLLPDNYRYYIGTGSRHTMWGSNKVYTDTTGGVPTLLDWVNGMLTGSAAWTNVECTNCGLTLAGDPKPSPLETPFFQVGPDVIINCPSSPSGAFLDGELDR